VAVAVENAIAFQEIEALKDQLAKENAWGGAANELSHLDRRDRQRD
jgi:hypothetical protein